MKLATIPVMAMLPLLVRVNAWQTELVPTCWFPQAALVGVTLTTDAPPVPVIGASAGEAGSLEVTEIVADRAPTVVGQNFALIVQEAPGVRV